MGSWSKRVPTDERVYEKHESVPNNPKITDASFCSGDVESWGRFFLKIKAECKTINAPLPTYLGITVEEFIDSFLEKEECVLGYQTKHKPCDFLQEDGKCRLGDCKPESCKSILILTNQRDYRVCLEC